MTSRVFVITAVLTLAPTAQGAVVAKIEQVGFPGGLTNQFGADRGWLVRHGVWAPMRFSLRVDGSEHFTGFFRVEQRDADGDVTFAQVPVTLTAGTQRARTFWLYYLPNMRSERAYTVSARLIRVDEDGAEQGVAVKTPDGASVERLEPASMLMQVPDDDRLVLDISTRPVEALRGLAKLDDEGEPVFRDRINTAHCAANEIPDAWYGLEMVDYILWDNADPTTLDAGSGQLDALVEWVRQGGCLLIGATDTWPALLRSPLGEWLPVTDAEMVPGTTFPGLDELGGIPSSPNADETVSFCKFKTHEEGRTVPAGVAPTSIFRERQVGHGRIVVVGAELWHVLNQKRLLASRPPGDLLAMLLRIPKRAVKFANQYRLSERRLFDQIKSFVGYQTEVGIRLIVAVLFVLAYIFVATFGSWEWLRRRQRLQHSWTAFAVVAAGASAISIFGVGWVQGLTTRVQQLTIVDGEAGRFNARARVLVGLKTPTHDDLDVWLPQDWSDNNGVPETTACWLRPMPGRSDLAETGYAAPGRYQVQPARASVQGVPVRATLKAFEGFWSGQLPGSLRASLKTTRRARRIKDEDKSLDREITEFTNDSWIANDLKVDLVDAYLLHAMDVWPGRESGGTEFRRDQNIFIRRLGPISTGDRIEGLADRLYRDAKGNFVDDAERGGTREAKPVMWNLMGAHKLWGGGGSVFARRSEFDGLPGHDMGVMLLTTLSEYIGEYGTGSDARTEAVRGDHGRQLDRSSLLAPDTALFIGFSEDAGPARIKIRATGGGDDDWRPIHPRSGGTNRRTVYRITLPIQTSSRIAAVQARADTEP